MLLADDTSSEELAVSEVEDESPEDVSIIVAEDDSSEEVGMTLAEPVEERDIVSVLLQVRAEDRLLMLLLLEIVLADVDEDAESSVVVVGVTTEADVLTEVKVIQEIVDTSLIEETAVLVSLNTLLVPLAGGT